MAKKRKEYTKSVTRRSKKRHRIFIRRTTIDMGCYNSTRCKHKIEEKTRIHLKIHLQKYLNTHLLQKLLIENIIYMKHIS